MNYRKNVSIFNILQNSPLLWNMQPSECYSILGGGSCAIFEISRYCQYWWCRQMAVASLLTTWVFQTHWMGSGWLKFTSIMSVTNSGKNAGCLKVSQWTEFRQFSHFGTCKNQKWKYVKYTSTSQFSIYFWVDWYMSSNWFRA